MNQSQPNATNDGNYYKDLLGWWENTIGNYAKGYFLLIGIILTLINNLAVLVVLLKGSQVKKKISKQMYTYYIAIAIGDTCTVITTHASYFAGK